MLKLSIMSEGESVMVGMRIRPFNDREKKLGAQLCVDVDGATTLLQNPPDVAAESGKGAELKKFTFDASFWSHDGFEEDESGYCRALPGSKYADQRLVFETFGKKVLDNAWEGYHCCLFAYGQTGAGKSYSMVGYGKNKGIVPVSCEEIFIRIAANPDPALSFEVMVSMVEIYNEAVQDLLVPSASRPKKGLDIRESQQLGIYIDGVKKRAVNSYPSIEAVMEEGTENRTVGSTLMNATSSRAHTVITIEFKQVSTLAGGASGEKVSMINLVDLAGSEKAGQTGASGDRLKEGCAINKSLSALGNVIEKLADKATGKNKNIVIPYRDSKLTRLLQNALGGSSKTIMICAISPASSNYEETLSTLRYADRAKRIKNSATINENPQDKLIRQLREENLQLRNMIGVDPGAPGGGGGETDAAALEALSEKQKEIAALESMLQEMQRSFTDKISEAQASANSAAQQKKEKNADLSMPHISNLNEDDLLTNKLRFPFKEGSTRIGRPSEGEGCPEVALSGPGIHPQHATVVNAAGGCVISAVGDSAATTFVNGAALQGKPEGVQLVHCDRVAFGQCYFVFVDPAVGTATDLLESGKVSYAMARKEHGAGEGPSEEEMKATRKMSEELERKVKVAEEASQRAKSEAEDHLKKREQEFQEQLQKRQEDWEREHQQKAEAAASDERAHDERAAAEQEQRHAEELARLQREFEDRQRNAEAAAAKRIQDLEAAAKKAVAEEEDHRQHELAMQRLEEELMNVMPLVKEANLIAQELKRSERLETKMHCELNGGKRGSVRVMAAVMRDGVRLFEWSPETLENRVFLLREILQRCEEEGFEVADQMADEDDPLWDPIVVERLIGVSQVLLEGLLLQVENAVDTRILSSEGHQAGMLRVEVVPLSYEGTPGVPDSEIVDEPEDLLGARLGCMIHVVRASDLPENLANDVRVEYHYFVDEKPHEVPMVLGHNEHPIFNYSKTFVQDPVTSRFLEYLQTKLVFRVYGKDSSADALNKSVTAAAAAATAPPPGRQVPEPITLPSATSLQSGSLESGSIEAVSPSRMSPSGLPGAIGDAGSPAAAAGPGPPGGPTDQGDVLVAHPSLAAVRRQAEEALNSPAGAAPVAIGAQGGKSKSCCIL